MADIEKFRNLNCAEYLFENAYGHLTLRQKVTTFIGTKFGKYLYHTVYKPNEPKKSLEHLIKSNLFEKGLDLEHVLKSN